jgi:hypothetical protein
MRQQNEGFLPLAQPQAHAQIDFGKFHYFDALDRDKDGFALTISFPYSNHGLTQVFPSENQECLLEGMKRIFKYIGGTPIRIKADNMTTAVAHVGKGAQRALTEGFARFMLHYRFQSDFCNPASGNEKGNVENKVGYSRRNFLVQVPTIEDFDVIIKTCRPLSFAVNSINRAMGVPDVYPFIITEAVVEKLKFIHRLLLSKRQ